MFILFCILDVLEVFFMLHESITFTSTLRMPTRYGDFTTNHIEYCIGDFSRSFHKHSSYELVYILSGRIQLNIGNHSLILVANNSILIKPGTLHEIHSDKQTEYFILHFNATLTNLIKPSSSEKALFLRFNYALSDENRQLVILDKTYGHHVLRNIKKELLEKEWGYKLLLGNQCANLLYLILRNLPAKVFKGKDFYDLPANNNIAVEIYNYIYNNIEKNLALEEVANLFHLSSRQVNRLLTDFYHQSFSVILNSIRLNKAKELIKTTELTMDEITELVGYTSYKSLYNLFKKYENLSPTEYRDRL